MNPNIKRLIEDSGFYVAYENKEVTEKELETLILTVLADVQELLLEHYKRSPLESGVILLGLNEALVQRYVGIKV